MTGRIAGLALVALATARAAPGQDVPNPADVLPFQRDAAVLPGPARSMGEAPFNQLLPPSDRADILGGGARSMGELPSALPGMPVPPIRPFLPNLPGGSILTPDILAPSRAIEVPENLLLSPGFLAPGGALSDDEIGRDRIAIDADERLPDAPRINGEPPEPPLGWADVRRSVETSYPPFLEILLERPFYDGQVTSALGSFDLKLSADSRNYPLGFYDRTVQDFFVELPLRDAGGKFFSGYRLGTGSFPSYYQNLQTRGGGAFVNGIELPLLRNREIDPQRAKLYKAEIERRKVEPTIQKARITLLKDAAKSYWEWLSAGYIYAISQKLAEATEAQYVGVQEQVQAGRLSQIDLVAFRSVFLKRKQQLIAANRDFQARSIALSLYARDRRGLPELPEGRHLPLAFPGARPPDESQFLNDLATAFQLRPELRGAEFEIQKARVDKQLADNQFLPSATFYVYTEQNIGNRSVDLGSDFRPFILESTFLVEVPLQRRFARGMIQSADAEIRQATAALQYAGDVVKTDVQQAYAALRAGHDNLVLYRENEALTRTLEAAERQRVELGGSNVLFLYIREQSSYDAQILRVAAEAKYFSALADYRAALGLDGLPPDLERLNEAR